MNMHACRDCRAPVSNSAKTCPHCGRPVHDSHVGVLLIGLVITVVFACVLLGFNPLAK